MSTWRELQALCSLVHGSSVLDIIKNKREGLPCDPMLLCLFHKAWWGSSSVKLLGKRTSKLMILHS